MNTFKRDITAIRIGILIIILVSVSSIIGAVVTNFAELDSFEDFKKGELKSTSVSSDGKLLIAPALEKIYTSSEDVIWDILINDKTAYFGTGNQGKVIAVNLKSREGKVVCDLDELEVYALCISSKGELYVGASPGGKIYRIKEDAAPEVFFETGEEYIWDIVMDSEGNMYTATGKEGKIFKISPAGKGEVFYDSSAANILTLALTPAGDLIAGSQAPSVIYKINAKKEGFVLYESGQKEVKQVICLADGAIYAAINAEQTPRGAIIDQIVKALENAGDKEAKKAPAKPSDKSQKSEIIKIAPDGFVRTIWQPDEYPINCIYFDSLFNLLLVSAGNSGMLYQINDRSDHVLCRKVENKYILALQREGEDLFMVTGSKAELYKLGIRNYREGIFLSKPIDAEKTVKWGNMEVVIQTPEKTGVKFRYRAGNTSEPDDSWSVWSKEIDVKESFLTLDVPVSRYIQLETRLTGPGIISEERLETETLTTRPISEWFPGLPSVDKVKLYYIEENVAPVILGIKFGVPTQKKPSAPPQQPSKPGEGAAPTPPQAAQAQDSMDRTPDSNPKKLMIVWQAGDPNKDKLLFEIYFKGEDEKIWKLLEEELDQPKFEFITSPIPDGKYRFKVKATDLPMNTPEKALTAEYISDLVIVDNTAPEILSLDAKREDSTLTVKAQATDATSILVSAKYIIDAQDEFYLLPLDGLFDSQKESFSFTVKDVKDSEHIVTLIVTDAEGNTTTQKVIVK